MKIIVIGCGRVGSELARSLSTQGHRVAVVDRNPQAFVRLGVAFAGRTIQGDVLDEAVLRRAGIDDADGFASVTPSDETNLVAAKTARDIFHVPNVVARVYDPAFAEVFTHAGLRSVISASWGARRIEQVLTGAEVAEIATLGDDGVLLVEIRVPSGWVGRPLGQVADSGSFRAAALLRNGTASFSDPGADLREGDRLVAVVRADDLPRLRELARGDEA